MPRKVDEYLGKNTQWNLYKRMKVEEVTAPSGLTYKIRSIPVTTLLKASTTQDTAEISIAILESSVLEPKLCRQEREDCISIDDIPPADALFLLNEISKLSDLDKLQDIINIPKNS